MNKLRKMLQILIRVHTGSGSGNPNHRCNDETRSHGGVVYRNVTMAGSYKTYAHHHRERANRLYDDISQ